MVADSTMQRVTAIGLTPARKNGMQYRHVGRSGLVSSAIGVGCFAFGGFVDQKGCNTVVGQALDLGINYFDTANSYGIGRSEEALGKALEGRRHDALIATKFGNRMGDGPNDAGASRLAILRLRGQPQAPGHRLHRPVPVALARPRDSDRRDPARTG